MPTKERHSTAYTARWQAERLRVASRRAPLDDLARLREAALAMVHATELTALAEVLARGDECSRVTGLGGGDVSGMSPAQVKEFLFGAEARAIASPGNSAGAAFAGGERVLIGMLLRDIPPERRHASAAELVEAIASEYRRHRVPLPSWCAAELAGSRS